MIEINLYIYINNLKLLYIQFNIFYLFIIHKFKRTKHQTQYICKENICIGECK